MLRPMVLFALPLIASGIFQQSFNAVDIAVVGRYAGRNALAAVGSNGPVIGLIINMFLGLAVGANVVIANYIGQRNSSGTRAATSAAAVLALVSGVLMLITAQLFARPILAALGTPADCFEDAVLYLRVFSVGMPFMIIYNFASAILRSVGDTRHPFYSLAIACCVNLVFDLFFVAGLGMGVDGVAWGTVIAQVFNAGYMIRCLMREKSDVRLDIRNIKPNWPQMRKICSIGLPAGLQSTVFSLSNVFILSAVNSFGALASAGSAAAINFEMYCYFVINAFGQTAVAFVSQNYGAGQLQRCLRAFWISFSFSIAASVVLDVLIAWNAVTCLAPFTADADVLPYAVTRIHTALLFQFIACFYELAGSTMRGLGHSMTPALITIFGTCVLRLLWVWFLPSWATFSQLLLVYPVSWVLTDILMAIAFRRTWRKVKLSMSA